MKRNLFFLILLLAACKTDEQLMDDWKGRSKVDLVAHWGAPTLIVSDNQSGEVLEYVLTLHSPDPAYRDGVYYRVRCFYVHADGTVYFCKCEDSRVPKVDIQ